MTPPGTTGYISCAAADATAQVIGDHLYLASMTAGPLDGSGVPAWIGWRLEKFDPVSWQLLASVDIPLDMPAEADDGPTISLINGQIDVTGEYFVDGDPDNPLGRGSHHHYFSTDLVALGERILQPPQYPAHCPMVSIVQANGGDIIMFASTEFNGDLMVLRFDRDWNLLEQRMLRENAFFPTGAATDGELFYVAYTDGSQRSSRRVYPNVRLAGYDPGWNVLQDVAATGFVPTDNMLGMRPWLTLHENRLYVSFNTDTIDPVTGEESPANRDIQVSVSVFALTRSPEY